MLKETSSVDKQSYSGPATFRKIIEQVVIDAKEKGYDLSYDKVRRVIILFFVQIYYYMFKGNLIHIDNFGSFGMTKKEKESRLKRDEARAKNKYWKRLLYYRRLMKRDAKIAKMNVINERRAKIGLKPLKLKEYIQITKRKKPKKPRCKPIINYTFDILDTQEKSK